MLRLERIRSLIRQFLQPWDTMLSGRLTPAIRAVSYGFALSLSLLGAGWALFVAAPDLDDRSAVSVLASPSFRVIQEGRKPKWIAAGTCEAVGESRPFDDIPRDDSSSYVCRGWYEPQGSGSNLWRAARHYVTPGQSHIETGVSRSDALGYLLRIPVHLAQQLMLPLGVAAVAQLGIATGYAKYRRDMDANSERGSYGD